MENITTGMRIHEFLKNSEKAISKDDLKWLLDGISPNSHNPAFRSLMVSVSQSRAILATTDGAQLRVWQFIEGLPDVVSNNDDVLLQYILVENLMPVMNFSKNIIPMNILPEGIEFSNTDTHLLRTNYEDSSVTLNLFKVVPKEEDFAETQSFGHLKFNIKRFTSICKGFKKSQFITLYRQESKYSSFMITDYNGHKDPWKNKKFAILMPAGY